MLIAAAFAAVFPFVNERQNYDFRQNAKDEEGVPRGSSVSWQSGITGKAFR